MLRILHLSHSDIRYDFRILRAMDAGLSAGHLVRGLGFDAGMGQNPDLGNTIQEKISSVRRSRMGAKRRAYGSGNQGAGQRMEVSQSRGGALNKVFLAFESLRSFSRELRLFRPEVIHVHDAPLLPLAYGARIFSRVSVVYDAHELNAERTGISWRMRLWTLFWERLAWPVLSGFVTVSEPIRKTYEDVNGPVLSVVVRNIHSPIHPVGLSHWLQRSARDHLGLGDKTVLFAYVGALEEGRMLKETVQAFSCVDEEVAVLMVLGAGTKRAELERVAQGGAIKFLDPVPNFALGSFLRGVDFGFCLLDSHNLNEFMALPNKLFEYVFAGVRPICSDFPEMAAIAESAGGLVWSQDNISQNVSHQIKEGRPVGLPGQYAERFSWKSEMELLQTLYETIHLSRRCREARRAP